MPDHEVDHLLAFVQERDVRCPLCGYNLRNLTRPVCPECRQSLELTVGVKQPGFAWLLVTLTPGAFSGIAAALLLLPIIIVPLIGGGPAPWRIISADAFGLLSGLATLVLVKYRYAFLGQTRSRQCVWAVATWAVHVTAFFVLIASFL